jgi:hypothetical protein
MTSRQPTPARSASAFLTRQFGGPSGLAGHIALGYQLRQNMPPVAQRTFPREGFTLYDSDDQVAAVLEQAGFTRPEIRIFGAHDRAMGRLALSAPAQRQASVDTAGRRRKAD